MKIKASEVYIRKTGKEFEVPEFKSPVPAFWAAEFAYHNGIFDYAQEHNFVIAIDAERNVCDIMNVNIGTERICPVDMKALAVFLINSGASNFVFFHNHPMGSCVPSEKDVIFTKKLKTLGFLLECHILGSVVLGKDGEFCDIENMLLHGQDIKDIKIRNVKDILK